MIPEVARTGKKTRTPFKFYQFPLNTNDATTGHKLQGMSKDQLILVTSWDGKSKWPNWAFTLSEAGGPLHSAEPKLGLSS